MQYFMEIILALAGAITLLGFVSSRFALELSRMFEATFDAIEYWLALRKQRETSTHARLLGNGAHYFTQARINS